MPGARAGIKPGDLLEGVRLGTNDEHPVDTTSALTRQMYRAGTWSKITYKLVREGVTVQVPVAFVHAPVQPANVEPVVAAAVSVTNSTSRCLNVWKKLISWLRRMDIDHESYFTKKLFYPFCSQASAKRPQ